MATARPSRMGVDGHSSCIGGGDGCCGSGGKLLKHSLYTEAHTRSPPTPARGGALRFANRERHE